jgi:hypothetical protein
MLPVVVGQKDWLGQVVKEHQMDLMLPVAGRKDLLVGKKKRMAR